MDTMLVEVTCDKCGRKFVVDLAPLNYASVYMFSDQPFEKRDYLINCVSCGQKIWCTFVAKNEDKP